MTVKDKNLDLMRLLSPAISMWDIHSDCTLDEAIAEWETALQQPQRSFGTAKTTKTPLANGVSSHKRIKANSQLKKWFQNTKAFNCKELKRLDRLAIFNISQSGQVYLKPAPLRPHISNLLLSFIIGIAGIWTGWIVFGTSANLELVVQSTGVGMALGAIASIVLDISHRHQSLYEKISIIAPQLVNMKN